jgi:LmbE family N-acetylglucosaminyl deacetylase
MYLRILAAKKGVHTMAWKVSLTGFLTLTVVLVLCVHAGEQPPKFAAFVSPHTRLVVFSPHPDDETLGAGGLIQRVLRAGGTVKVVFMTSGDGFPGGVALARHILVPTAQDYRTYGMLRQEEAKRALATLGVPGKDVIFLGFPDGGLCPLRVQYPSDQGSDYTSPYTLEDRPPSINAVLPNTDYNGEDLQREIVWILRRFHPTLVVTTHPWDRHPDHCATYLFVREALQALPLRAPMLRPLLFTFLIHFGGWWPMGAGVTLETPLHLPPSFPEPERTWLPFPLSPAEGQAKRQALLQYHSQMLAMGQYLLSFVRANELFAPDSQKTQAELRQVPCCSK